MGQDTNVLFLKAAVKLGELDKTEAKGCLKELKQRSGDAGKLAVKRGHMSMSGRMRVQTRVDRHLAKALSGGEAVETKPKSKPKAKASRTGAAGKRKAKLKSPEPRAVPSLPGPPPLPPELATPAPRAVLAVDPEALPDAETMAVGRRRTATRVRKAERLGKTGALRKELVLKPARSWRPVLCAAGLVLGVIAGAAAALAADGSLVPRVLALIS